jgi:hypothetical protein
MACTRGAGGASEVGANSVRAALDTSECLAALRSFPALTLTPSARHFTDALFSPRLDDDEAEMSRLGGTLSFSATDLGELDCSVDRLLPSMSSMDCAELHSRNPSLGVLRFGASGCNNVAATSLLGCNGTALSCERQDDAISIEHSGERKPAFFFFFFN